MRKATVLLLLSVLVLGAMGFGAWIMPLRTTEAASSAMSQEKVSGVVYPQLVADACVSSVAYTTNFGDASYLDVQNYDGQEFPDDRRSYVGFDLSKIPSDAVITSAAFKAYLYEAEGLGTVNIYLRRVTSPWAEMSVTWSNKPSSGPYTKMSVDSTTGMKGWDVTRLVQDYWVNRDFGQSPNFGLELRGPESGDYYLRGFNSYESGKNQPYLIVSYEMPTHTPTPTATDTPTATPTHTPTATPSPSPTPTSTPADPDPYEPNETFATARSVAAGVYQAYISSPYDQDWFAINLSPLQELQVTLKDLPKDYDMEIRDPYGVLIGASHNRGTTADQTTATASQLGGVHRIRVLPVGGESDPDRPYTLVLRPGPPPPTPTHTPTPTPTAEPSCAADPYEPNDSSADAASLATGTEIQAYICPAMDSDYFTFPVSGAVEIHARLYDLPASYELTLYSPAGWPVAQGSGTGTEPRELTHRPTSDGDFLLRVGPSSPDDWDEDAPYSLRVDLDELSPIGIYAVADTYVDELNPTDVHGDERQVYVSRDEFGYERRGLFRFSMHDVPVTTISSAYFRVSLYSSATRIQTIHLRRVSGDWDEDTTDWHNKPWSVDIGVSAGIGGATDQYYEWDVTDLVQGWLTGGVGNFGLELRAGPDVFDRAFRSSDYPLGLYATAGSGSALTPKLVINFTEETPGPTGSIGGRVYDDADSDGRYDAGESGMSGARVELFGDEVSRGDQTTAGDGTYAFDSLAAGDYEVEIYESSLPGEVELVSPARRSVTLAAGEDRGDLDFRVEARPTPTPIPPPTLDLVAEGMEVIQVLHDATLIEGKTTLVRVYVGVEGVDDPVRNVNAILWRDGHPADVIEAMNRTTVELPVEDDPMNNPDVIANMDHTINFLLPDAWTTTDTFWVHVNANAGWVVSVPECAGCNVNNQVHGLHRFETASPLQLAIVDVTADEIDPPDVSHAGVYYWARKVYPVSRLIPYADTLSVSYDLVTSDGCDRCCGTGWGELLDDIEDVQDHSSRPDEVMYYGIISTTVPHCWWPTGAADQWCCSGCGRPGSVAAGLVDPGNLEGAGQTLAHEIGHSLDRPHTCACDEPDCVSQHPGAVIGVYGVDLGVPSSPVYLDPNTHHDIMSYCGSRWVSDITYEFLVDHFVSSAARRSTQHAQGAEQTYLVGSGTVEDGLVTMSRPFYQLTYPIGTSDGTGKGPYTLELQDANGSSLFTRHFDTRGTTLYPLHGDSFHEIVPWQPDAARIVIRAGSTVLHVTHVSANAPKVTLLSPNGGEVWPPYGEHTVSWGGSDADGDPLRYALSYSPDGGSTWKAVAVNLSADSYVLSAGTLAGSETALFRVTASDGVNTSQDQSDAAFTVEGKPPQPYILYPSDGSISLPGRPVILEGDGIDMEDGPLTDDTAFTWSSSLQGELGVGRHLYFDALEPGRHTITLTVRDSDGFVAQESVSILIGRPVYLPLLLKNR